MVKTKEKKSIVKKKVKEIQTPQLNDVNSLIQFAIENKSGVDQLKELMKMKYEHEARESKKIFHEQFCSMQAEFPVIQKRKVVKSKHGKELYKYAPIEDIILQIKTYLQKYGFSYHWSEESLSTQNMKRIYCHITGHGHSESSYIDIPIMPKNDFVNSIQQIGSSTTYGKRYSLSDILGIMVEDDDDGRGSEPKKQILLLQIII